MGVGIEHRWRSLIFTIVLCVLRGVMIPGREWAILGKHVLDKPNTSMNWTDPCSGVHCTR